MQTKTPIMLVTGSLGSGKTTLLRRIVDTSSRRIAVLMNEFGETTLDSELIRGRNVEVISLPGGCVCCSLSGEFEAAVRSLLERAKPQAIVVETADMARLGALAEEVQQKLTGTRLDSVVYVADAYTSVTDPAAAGGTLSRVSGADIVLINKIDLVTMEEIKRVEAHVRQHNPHAVVFKTMGCDVDTNLLFGHDVERFRQDVGHHGEPVFQSFYFTCDAPLDQERFYEAVSRFPKEVYRAKGFVIFNGNAYLFNYVVGRADLEEFPAERTQIVFIGRELERVRHEILQSLKHCASQPRRS